MAKFPEKCSRCGAPFELDTYKDIVKCNYCGTINIFENGRLISKSDRYLNKIKEYLPELKKKKIFIPTIIFSTLFLFGIYKVNYIDDFLVKECKIRDARSSVSEFVAKKNYRKCLRNIKSEWKKKVKEAKVEIKNSCKIVNQKAYKSILDEQAVYEPETDNKYFIFLEEQEIRDRLNNFEPKFTKDLPWSEKFYFAEIFSVKDCKKLLSYNLKPHVIFKRPKSSFE